MAAASYEALVGPSAQKRWDEDGLDDGSSQPDEAAIGVQDTTAWRVAHAASFATGGLTFIAGTGLYFVSPQTDAIGNLAAALYTVGSVGFLTVDVMEFFTPAYRSCPLRFNIALSATGSTLYVVGSLGYLPAVLAATEAVGVWGFILGSALIGTSQIWKLLRYATDDAGRTSLGVLLSSRDRATAAGVEGGACLGAWLFFVGTVMYAHAVTPDAWMTAILAVWMAGSAFFTVGAMFLCHRHFVMGVS